MRYGTILSVDGKPISYEGKAISNKYKLTVDIRDENGNFGSVSPNIFDNPVGGKILHENDIGYYFRVCDLGIYTPGRNGGFTKVICEEPLITSMYDMFNNIGDYYGVVDLSRLNTSNVTNMQLAFSIHLPDGCGLDLSNFDTRNVKKFYRCFCRCNMEYLDLSNWVIDENSNHNEMFGSGPGSIINADILHIYARNVDDVTRNILYEQLQLTGHNYVWDGRWQEFVREDW